MTGPEQEAGLCSRVQRSLEPRPEENRARKRTRSRTWMVAADGMMSRLQVASGGRHQPVELEAAAILTGHMSTTATQATNS